MGVNFCNFSGIILRTSIHLNKNGRVRIIDFGIAQVLSKPIGGPEFMSPEQLQGFKPDEGSDIYSLGVLFQEMVGQNSKDNKRARKADCK